MQTCACKEERLSTHVSQALSCPVIDLDVSPCCVCSVVYHYMHVCAVRHCMYLPATHFSRQCCAHHTMHYNSPLVMSYLSINPVAMVTTPACFLFTVHVKSCLYPVYLMFLNVLSSLRFWCMTVNPSDVIYTQQVSFQGAAPSLTTEPLLSRDTDREEERDAKLIGLEDSYRDVLYIPNYSLALHLVL